MTNIPELGLSYACANVMYGTTNNPYDIARTPGGSSGGEVRAGTSQRGKRKKKERYEGKRKEDGMKLKMREKERRN